MSLTSVWHRFHRRPRWVRWPLKAAVFAIVVLLVVYPRVWLIPTWLSRLGNLNAVIDPHHPVVDEFAGVVLENATADAELPDVARAVEAVVRQRIPYAYDWETWGVMDYLPTVDEAVRQGREDCDGLAVIAASVLRRLGYDAWLVSDLLHTWVVATDRDADPPLTVELMSPGRGDKTLTGHAEGTQARLSPATLANVGRALSFGVAVFPLGRELVIVAALWLVLMQPRSPWWRRMAGGAVLLAALMCLRAAWGVAPAEAYRPSLAWLGLAGIAAGCVLLVYRAPKPRPGT